jgi:hypothetical protein
MSGSIATATDIPAAADAVTDAAGQLETGLHGTALPDLPLRSHQGLYDEPVSSP